MFRKNEHADDAITARQEESTQARRRAAEVGDIAPDFALPDATGARIRLSDFRGKKDVVLYFYPKDNTPGCTAEACSFRDNYDAIDGMDAEVLGVSSDSQADHEQFSTQLHLPFPLLSDEGGAVRKLYGVPTTLGLLPGRVTYVIDRQGVIRHIFTSQLNIDKHVAQALATLRTLNAAK